MPRHLTTPLPPDLVAALTVPRPRGRDWDRAVELVDYYHDGLDVAAVKRHLSRWPRELPRPAAKHWTATLTGRRRDAVLSLCLDVDEVDTYPLYVEALCVSPPAGLRLRSGQPAMTLWRQPRGVVELSNGTKMKLGEDGMADLGGVMVVETKKPGPCSCGNTDLGSAFSRLHDGSFTETTYHCEDCGVEVTARHAIELYVELEVKLDGKIPPTAKEFTGTSKRKLTETEEDQVKRQRVRTSRGGVYLFADSVADAVDRFVAVRADIQRRLTA